MKKQKQRKHNWNTIRNEYIQGNMSYQTLSKKYDVSINTLFALASKKREGWSNLRQKYRNELTKKTLENNVEKEAEAILSMKEKERKNIDFFEQAIFLKLIVKRKGKNVINDSLAPQDINSLSAAFERCQKMRYKSFGISEKVDADVHHTGGKIELVVSKDFIPGCNLDYAFNPE